jgi:hypothetical protein
MNCATMNRLDNACGTAEAAEAAETAETADHADAIVANGASEFASHDRRSARPGDARDTGNGWVRDARRGIDLGPVHTEIASATCRGEPACALVIAVYGASPW